MTQLERGEGGGVIEKERERRRDGERRGGGWSDGERGGRDEDRQTDRQRLNFEINVRILGPTHRRSSFPVFEKDREDTLNMILLLLFSKRRVPTSVTSFFRLTSGVPSAA